MASTPQSQCTSAQQRSADTTAADEEASYTTNAFDTTRSCVECGSTSFEWTAAGEWYCVDCGIVQAATELEFSEPGWRPREQRRTGPASSPARVSDGNVIGRGEGLSHRARKLDNRLPYDKAALRHGLKELRAVASKLEAPDFLTEQAAYQYRQAAAEGLLPGHSIEAMAAACLYAVARENGTPYPKKQFADASPVSFQDICSAYSRLCRAFSLEVKPAVPTDFIARFVSEAGFSQAVRRRALRAGRELIDDEKHVGQSPTGVAGALVYGAARATDTDTTQEDIAEIAHVSSVTLSRQWQTVQSYFEDVC